MKTILPGHRDRMQTVLYTVVGVLFFMLVQLPFKANAAPEQPYKDSIVINKLLTSKKYKIRIYPGANQEVLFFNASGEDGKVYQFYLFDLDGTLVKQTQIRNKQTSIITNFNKGCFTFEIFSDDEHIENGTLTIK